MDYNIRKLERALVLRSAEVAELEKLLRSLQYDQAVIERKIYEAKEQAKLNARKYTAALDSFFKELERSE
jgi:inorganic triphosphatase YgiF